VLKCVALEVRKPFGDGVEAECECADERECVVRMRELVGFSDPAQNWKADEHTQAIRGCFGQDLVHNAVDVYYKQTHSEFARVRKLLFAESEK